jgi:glycine cleavage system H protein
MVPEELKYTRDHEWVRIEGREAVVGITQHAQAALGDITFVELPKIGRAMKAHEPLAVVESVKAASDIFAPLAGVVAAVNDALAQSPERINQSPYEGGWICRLKDVDAAAAGELLTAEGYRKLLTES